MPRRGFGKIINKPARLLRAESFLSFKKVYRRNHFSNTMLFPAPMPPKYTSDKFKGRLYYVPRTRVRDSFIPVLIYPSVTAKRVILYSHMNAEDIGLVHRCFKKYHQPHHYDAHVCVWDFRGYGLSGGKAHRDAINDDILDVYAFIKNIFDVPNNQLFLYGQSIGTGPSCWLARHLCKVMNDPPGGVTLVAGYCNIREVVKDLIQGSPDVSEKDKRKEGKKFAKDEAHDEKELAMEREEEQESRGSLMTCFSCFASQGGSKLIPKVWRSEFNMEQVTCPVLLIHGSVDPLIPVEHSKRLYEACPNDTMRKTLRICEGRDHLDFDIPTDIIAPFTEFMDHHHTGSKIRLPKERAFSHLTKVPRAVLKLEKTFPKEELEVSERVETGISTFAHAVCGFWGRCCDPKKRDDLLPANHPASRQKRAATTIQSAWRAKHAREEVERRRSTIAASKEKNLARAASQAHKAKEAAEKQAIKNAKKSKGKKEKAPKKEKRSKKEKKSTSSKKSGK